MKLPHRLLLSAAAASTLLIAADGAGQPVVPKQAPVVVLPKPALNPKIANATAMMDAQAKARIAAAAAAATTAREQSAQLVRSSALTRPGRTIPPSLPNPKAPFVSEVYSGGRAVTPMSTVILFGGNLKGADATNEIHILFGGRDLVAKALVGSLCTADRCEVVIPDYEGITGPTPATLTVKQGGMTSAPASLTLSPELVQVQADLSLMKAALLKDFKGTPLVYDDKSSSDYFYFVDNVTLYGVHARPWGTATVMGTDEYFLTTKLKNNWVLKDVMFADVSSLAPDANPGQSGTALNDLHRNTSSPWIQVGWHPQPATVNQGYYVVRFLFEGPKGTTYY
jgi:hypothetical protein